MAEDREFRSMSDEPRTPTPKPTPMRAQADAVPTTPSAPPIRIEDGSEIPRDPEDFKASHPERERRVKGANGAYYLHTTEDSEGHWLYREDTK